MEIEKIEQTEEQIKIGDQVEYIFKIPYEVQDEYGNSATLFKKEIVLKSSLLLEKESLLKQLENLQNEINVIDNKLLDIDNLK